MRQQYLYYLIKVKQIRYFLFKSKTSVKLMNGNESISIDSLPLGGDFNFKIHYFDDIGDEFHAKIDKNNLKLDYSFEPKRFTSDRESIRGRSRGGKGYDKFKIGTSHLSIVNLNNI